MWNDFGKNQKLLWNDYRNWTRFNYGRADPERFGREEDRPLAHSIGDRVEGTLWSERTYRERVKNLVLNFFRLIFILEIV